MKHSGLFALFVSLWVVACLCVSCTSPQNPEIPQNSPTCGSAPHRLSFASQQRKQEPVRTPSPETAPSSPSLPEDHGSWWVKKCGGALSETEHPLVSKVQKVFDRVLDAADKRGTRFPKLIILQGLEDPWAACLKDGSILLSQKAMEFCYHRVDEKTGDARVAFVLGHELAHLAKDDFWHIAAFEALTTHGTGSKATQAPLELLDVENPALAKQRELQADAYGLIFATMAGYDPKVIVHPDGKNFIMEWVRQMMGGVAYSGDEGHDDEHPPYDHRAEFLIAHMKQITDDLHLFHFGVRLYQLGKYEESRDFLLAFQERFPSREVFNNIGLTYYQRDFKELATCDPDDAYRFKLSTIVDTQTLARLLDTGEKPGTRRDERCRRDLFKDAVRYFRRACDADRFYVPARVNLSSALILTGRYAAATGVLNQVPKTRADDPKVSNNRAVALYRHGPAIRVEMFHQASGLLKEVIETHPEFSDAYFNLARFQDKRGRVVAAREKTWKEFLRREPVGVYAEIARERVGTRQDRPAIQNNPPRPFGELAPVRLGELDRKIRQELTEAGFTDHERNLGEHYADYFSSGDALVLALDKVVELMEFPVKEEAHLSDMAEDYNPPHQICC